MHDEGPDILPVAIFYLLLYKRIRRWKGLPDAGGLLDQDERTMRLLDIVADEVEEYEAEQAALREQRRTNAQALGGLNPGARVFSVKRPNG